MKPIRIAIGTLQPGPNLMDPQEPQNEHFMELTTTSPITSLTESDQLLCQAASPLGRDALKNAPDELLWQQVNHWIQGAAKALKFSLVQQIMAGFHLQELQQRWGLSHGGNRQSNGPKWKDLVQEKTGYSYRTTTTWVQLARNLQARVAQLALTDGPATEIASVPPSQWQPETTAALQQSLAHITTGWTQLDLMRELGLVKPADAKERTIRGVVVATESDEDEEDSDAGNDDDDEAWEEDGDAVIARPASKPPVHQGSREDKPNWKRNRSKELMAKWMDAVLTLQGLSGDPENVHHKITDPEIIQHQLNLFSALRDDYLLLARNLKPATSNKSANTKTNKKKP